MSTSAFVNSCSPQNPFVIRDARLFGNALSSCHSSRRLQRKRRNPHHYRHAKIRLALTLPSSVVIPAITLLSTSAKWGPNFQNAPAAFLMGTVLANLRLVPTVSPFHSAVMSLAPHAVTLLLLNPRPKKHRTASNKDLQALLPAFLLGSFATFVGAFLSALVRNPRPPSSLPAAFAATYIGGTLNLIAIAKSLALSNQLAAAAMATDLIAMAFYFAALFALAGKVGIKVSVSSSKEESLAHDVPLQDRFYEVLTSLPLPLGLAWVIVYVFSTLVQMTNLPPSFSLLSCTTVSYFLSSQAKLKRHLTGAGIASTIMLNLFFATLGASASIGTICSASRVVLSTAFIILGTHALIMFFIGFCILRMSPKALLIASNANVGGATTAPAFAAACGWTEFVPAAVAVGTLGYAIGTPAALILHRLLGALGSIG